MSKTIVGESVTIDDAFLIMKASSGDENVTLKWRGFLGSHKTVIQVSLDGHWGRKNGNHHEIYTYLNAAKAEDPGYTNF